MLGGIGGRRRRGRQRMRWLNGITDSMDVSLGEFRADPPPTASGISTCAAQVYPALGVLPARFQPQWPSPRAQLGSPPLPPPGADTRPACPGGTLGSPPWGAFPILRSLGGGSSENTVGAGGEARLPHTLPGAPTMPSSGSPVPTPTRPPAQAPPFLPCGFCPTRPRSQQLGEPGALLMLFWPARRQARLPHSRSLLLPGRER